MKRIKERDRAYTAGFMDGEGCIHIAKRKPTRRGQATFHYSLIVSIWNVQPEPLEFIQTLFGGSIAKHLVSNPSWRDSYQLQLNPVDAQELLIAIYPYLIIKKDEVDLALRFIELRKVKGNCKPSSPEYLRLQEEIYQEMKGLKERCIS